MHAGPHSAPRGTWIWLPTAAFSAAVIAAVVISYGGGGCKPAGGGPSATAPARAASSSALPTRPAASPAPTASGVALYYDPGAAVGSCLMGPFSASGYYVSLPPAQYGDGAACGTYLNVHGPKGAVRAEVVDLCPSCSATTVNLSRAAFDRIADPTPGSAQVTYWQAANPPLHHWLEVRVVSGPSIGGVSLQILHHGNALVSVAVAAAGASTTASDSSPGPASPSPANAVSPWQKLAVQPNGFWASTGPLGPGPFDLRLVDALGHEVVLTNLTLTPGTVIRPRRRMYLLTATPPSASPSPQPDRSSAASVAAQAAAGGCPSK